MKFHCRTTFGSWDNVARSIHLIAGQRLGAQITLAGQWNWLPGNVKDVALMKGKEYARVGGVTKISSHQCLTWFYPRMGRWQLLCARTYSDPLVGALRGEMERHTPNRPCLGWPNGLGMESRAVSQGRSHHPKVRFHFYRFHISKFRISRIHFFGFRNSQIYIPRYRFSWFHFSRIRIFNFKFTDFTLSDFKNPDLTISDFTFPYFTFSDFVLIEFTYSDFKFQDLTVSDFTFLHFHISRFLISRFQNFRFRFSIFQFSRCHIFRSRMSRFHFSYFEIP
jgi:hypothetical protein